MNPIQQLSQRIAEKITDGAFIPENWIKLSLKNRERACRVQAEKICEYFGIRTPELRVVDENEIQKCLGMFDPSAHVVLMARQSLEAEREFKGLEVLDILWHELTHARQYELQRLGRYRCLLPEVKITQEAMAANYKSCQLQHISARYPAVMNITGLYNHAAMDMSNPAQYVYYCQPAEYEAWMYSGSKVQEYVKDHNVEISDHDLGDITATYLVHNAAEYILGTRNVRDERRLVTEIGNAMINLVYHDYLPCNPYLQEKIKEAAIAELNPKVFEERYLLDGQTIEDNMFMCQFIGDRPENHAYGKLTVNKDRNAGAHYFTLRPGSVKAQIQLDYKTYTNSLNRQIRDAEQSIQHGYNHGAKEREFTGNELA